MKRYRLKKLYPGLLELGMKVGDIVEYVKTYNHYTKNNVFNSSARIIKNSPEYWELIIEKDWEILSFKGESSPAIWELLPNGKYKVTSNINYLDYVSLEDLLKNRNIHIYQVLRKSDQQIFTLEDSVYYEIDGYKYDDFKIDRFEIRKEDKDLYIRSSGEQLPKCVLRDLIKVSKSKLFITEDNKELYEGDSVYGVGCKIFDYIGQYKLNTKYKEEEIIVITDKRYAKWFSNEDQAKNYIILNKPVFSVKDVYNIIDMSKDSVLIKHFVRDRAEGLVKF